MKHGLDEELIRCIRPFLRQGRPQRRFRPIDRVALPASHLRLIKEDGSAFGVAESSGLVGKLSGRATRQFTF
jgi:hypothetical protein